MFAVLSRLFTLGLLFIMLSCSSHRFGEVRSIEAEKEFGEDKIPAFLLAKGGVYTDADAQRYVQALTAKLSANATIPDGYKPIPIKVLNTNTPSAYALPGGSIYVSRGMIAMASDEAQLAGVIAHEIGHVMARHSAKSVAATEKLILDAVIKKSDRLSRETSEARQVAIIQEEIETRIGEITSFSKEQELEADRLAIQILTASGYGSKGYGDLLKRLDQWQLRQAARAGLTSVELVKIAERSGYPAITDRVAALGSLSVVPVDPEAQGRLMSAIDGLTFEDRYNGGFIRNSTYWHPVRRISFDVPQQFLAEHGKYLSLLSSNGIVQFRLDRGVSNQFEKMVAKLEESDSIFGSPKPTTINDISAVIATGQAAEKGQSFVGEIAIYDLGSHVASLTMISKMEDESAARPLFKKMTNSFRRIDSDEVPRRRTFKTRRIAPGESVTGLAEASAFDGDRELELRLLNDFKPGQTIAAGDWIKLVE